MKRFVLVALVMLWSSSFAGTTDPTPLCPKGAPSTCVVPNWGVIEPGATDNASADGSSPSLLAARTAPKSRMAIKMMPAALSGSDAPSAMSPLKSVVSPQGLFPKETAALVTALNRTRFNDDGSIKSGEAALRRAAAIAAKRAGDKYALTLYIKVPQELAADTSAVLAKKVDALNAILSNPSDSGRTGTPRT